MSKTFLQLCQDTARECGISGSASNISTVLGQTGQAAKIVEWVRQAHDEIQNRSTVWRWMRSRFAVNTVAGDDSYAPTDCTDSRLSVALSRFGSWIPFDDNGAANIKRYLTSSGVAGESWMVFVPWSYYQAIYRRGTQNNGPIVHVSIDPQNNLVVGPKPDGIYTVSGEYQMSKFSFAADADVPEFPAQFHDLVTYRAMEKFGRFSAAPEVLARSLVEGGRVMRQLEANQLPQIGMGAPLA